MYLHPIEKCKLSMIRQNDFRFFHVWEVFYLPTPFVIILKFSVAAKQDSRKDVSSKSPITLWAYRKARHVH